MNSKKVRLAVVTLLGTSAFSYGQLRHGARIPNGFRVYVTQHIANQPSVGKYMGQVPNGSGFKFSAPAALTVDAMSVRIMFPGSKDGGTDIWTCSNGASNSLSVSLPAGSKEGVFSATRGRLSMRKGDSISCQWHGRGKRPPFADIALSGS